MIAGLVRRHFKAVIPLVTLMALALAMAGFGGFQQVSTDTFSVPTNVAAASADGTITVTWTPGAGASSQVIVAVNVLDDTDYCLGFDPTGRASSHECPGLTISATYVVLVIALDGAGGYRLGKDAQGHLVTHTLVSPPVSEEVGAGEAATVTHDSGAQLEVPAGALPEATTVSIAEVRPPASDIPVGRVYDFSVGEVELAQPATLRIPYELPAGQPTELLYAVHWNEDVGEWERVEAEVDETTGAMVVSTTELSRFSYALVSVDATCSAEPDANRFTMTSSITSRTLFDVTVFMAPEASETTRGATFFDKSDVRSSSRTLSRKETRTFSESFSLRYVGDYEARCRIFWEVLGAEIELKQKGDDSIVIGVSQNAAPDRALSKLNECSSSAVDPVTGKTTRNFGNARTVLRGESLGFTANGFAYGEDKIFTPRNTPHLVVAIAGYYDSELLDKSIGRKKAVTKGYSSIPLATTSFTFSEVGEYTIDCVLWWFLDDPKIPDFRNQTEESIKDLLRCILDGTACLGYLKALRDVRTVTVTAVPALWSQRPMEIEPPQLPAQGGSRDVTVRVYTRESRTIQHSATAPTITALLPASLVPSGAGSQQKGAVSRCGITHHDGYDEFCWEAVFAGIPESTARAEKNAAGEITETNEAEVAFQVSSRRQIAGPVPSGFVRISARSPYSDDREALLVFYEATRGEFWLNDEQHWGTERDIGDWYGVNDSSLITDTDKTADRVISLELRLNRLSGEIPDALSYLTSLKVLEITGHREGNGNLRGSIPDSLGNLANLTHLDLHGNALSGQIPATLGSLKNLVELAFDKNNLTGEIPSSLGELPLLEALYISDNRLTGCIPVGLRRLEADDFDDTDLPFCDVALSSLTISPGELDPAFETQVMRYSATVSEPQVSIVPVNDHAATFEYYVGSSRTPATVADPSAVGFQADLDCGKTTVRIKVISADREEDDTYTIEFTRGGVGLPAAPTIHSVSRGTGSLTVSWTAPDTSCGGTIDRYNLRYSLDQDDAAWTEVQGPSSGLSHTVSGLSAGTTYRVQAQAVNEHGAGPWSGTFVASTASDTVTQGNPDLVVDSPALGVPAPGSLEPGGSFTLSTTVRNRGNGTSAAATLRYYRSTDSSISTEDTEVGTDDVVSLGASGTHDATIDLTAPATAGTYYYRACVDTVANESNTQNNCSGAVAATVTEPTETEVDLSVSSPSVSRSEVGPGGRFSLHVTVGITGVDEPNYIVPLSYHRSGDSSISDSDAWIRSETLLLGPPSYGERTGIILYAADDFGVSYYGACVYYSDPDETNTQNNCSAGVAVTVTESIQTIQDLKMGNSPTVTDSNPAPGGRFTLSVAVRNTGNAATPGTTSRYYRSSDSTITSGDTEVGTSTVNRLYPGQSVPGAITLTAPSDADTYYYGACVDSVPRESDTTNNCSSGVEVTVQ